MTNDKYVGLDVHQASTSIAVIDGDGKSVVEGVVRTRADAIRDFINGLSGNVRVTLEEGTQAAWLYEIVKPLVVEVVVCDPRQNKVLAVNGIAPQSPRLLYSATLGRRIAMGPNPNGVAPLAHRIMSAKRGAAVYRLP